MTTDRSSVMDQQDFYRRLYTQYGDLEINVGEYSPCEQGPTETPTLCRLEPAEPEATAAVKQRQARSMWSGFAAGLLMEDVAYGQSGLEIYSTDVALAKTVERLDFDDRFRAGDLILGEFLGSVDLLLLDEQGTCIVANEASSRSDWTRFHSMENMFRAFLYCQGWQIWDYRGWSEADWRSMPAPGRKYSIDEGFLD